MKNKDPRIDAYIEKAADFAKPVLKYLRKIVHETCPQVEETIKWGMPHFDYHGPFCGMASFKAHCAFNFWKAALMKNATVLKQNQQEGMGHLGKIRTIKDLPSEKILVAMIEDAMMLNETGTRLPSQPKKSIQEIVVPEILTKHLKKNKTALKYFNDFSPSHRREYCEWIEEAKTDTTKLKRTEQTIEWLAEGKSRHWKYEKQKK